MLYIILILKDKRKQIVFNSVHIQRYLTKDKLVNFFEDEGLYFRRIDQFPDKTEGVREYYGSNQKKIVEGINYLMKQKYPNFPDMTEEEGEKLALQCLEAERKRTFIQSWFWDTEMSDYMWDEYAGRNKDPDCAILVVDRMVLGNYLDRVHYGTRMQPVKYVDSKLDQYDGTFPKLEKFKPESEFRLAIENICPQTNQNQRIVFKNDFGFVLKLELKKIISGIIIPNNASHEFEKMINQQLAELGAEYTCKRLK